MGIDLTLIPAQKSLAPNANHWSSSVVLPLAQSYDLWNLIVELPSDFLGAPLYTPIGWIEQKDMDTLSEDELEEDDYPRDKRCLTEDVFDSPLRSVAVSELVTLRSHEKVQASPENRAAWAYLAELPPETKVVLYWC